MKVISYKHYAVKTMFVLKFSCSYLKHVNVKEVFKFLVEMFNNSCGKSSSGRFYLLYLKFKVNNPAECEMLAVIIFLNARNLIRDLYHSTTTQYTGCKTSPALN